MKPIIFLIAVFVAGIVSAQEISVLEIIRKIDATERVESSKSQGRQIITTSGGEKRTLEMTAYTKNKNEKQLMIYTAPSRIKGDKILMLNEGNDIWFYTPKTDRVRHLASHAKRQKVQGSDFNYEDMAAGSIEKDYTFKLLGKEKVDDHDGFKLELIPTKSGPHYSRLILWADAERFITLRIDYYEDGELLKRLLCKDIRQIQNHWYAMKLVMTNVLEGGKTVFETAEIEFDLEMDDDLFTTKNMKRR